MGYYIPLQSLLEAVDGNLTFVGAGASITNQHAPHFADDVWRLSLESAIKVIFIERRYSQSIIVRSSVTRANPQSQSHLMVISQHVPWFWDTVSRMISTAKIAALLAELTTCGWRMQRSTVRDMTRFVA